MSVFLFTEWWISLGWDKQIFWSIAIVSSLLLLILLTLNLFGLDLDSESEEEGHSRKPHFIDSRSVLVFFTTFGWMAISLSGVLDQRRNILIFSLLAGIFAVFLVRFIAHYFSRIYRLNHFDVVYL